MSTTQSAGIDRTVEACRPSSATAVTIEAAELTSTAPGHLRDLKRELGEKGLVPATVAVTARFDEDCSLATQAEADRLREVVRAASFLGAARVEVAIESVADDGKVRPALEACAERADREGVLFEVDGPFSLD